MTSVTIKFNAVLCEKMLGTVPQDKELFTNFVAEKIATFQGSPIKTIEDHEEELETFPEGRGATSFHSDKDSIFIYNYMVLGNIKANIKILMDNGAIPKITNYKRICDLFLEIFPRRIRFHRDGELLTKPDDTLERSIRGFTPKGERTFLAKSDVINEGARFSFQIKILRNINGLTPEAVIEAAKVGKIHGLGQWRGSGKFGKFRLISVKVK